MADKIRLPLVATCSRGLEKVLAGELVGLGWRDVEPGRGMVRGWGNVEALFNANLQLRTAVRVLLPLAVGPGGDREALYALAESVPWEDLIMRGQTVAVTSAGPSVGFRDRRFPALVVKDALVDRLRARRGWRPDVDRDYADIRVHLHLGTGEATISLDSSGEPLSHRGYRPRGGPAPLAETLAAGLLLLAGYRGESPFCDPMCGTGTLAIEAALIATRTAPGWRRSFAMERWGWVDRRLGKELRRQVAERRVTAPYPIFASDRDARAVRATRRNAQEAGVGAALRVIQASLRELPVCPSGTLIVTNPPYGLRMGERDHLAGLYQELGDTLKRVGEGCTAWILAGEPALLRALRLAPSRRMVLFNGSLECRYVRYDLYPGRPASPRSLGGRRGRLGVSEQAKGAGVAGEGDR